MFDNAKKLFDKIRLGEDSSLELKEVLFAGQRDSLADELAAFANGRGGVCVLGVEDRARGIVGIPLEQLSLVEDLVREVCSDSIEPPLLPVIERLVLPTTLATAVSVLKVEVPRSLFVHRSPSGYFHRVGSSKRVMRPDYLARLFQQRSQARLIRFDEESVPRANLDDRASKLWERSRTYRTRDSREDLLQKVGMAVYGRGSLPPPSPIGATMRNRPFVAPTISGEN